MNGIKIMECFLFKNCANLFALKKIQFILSTEPLVPVVFRPAANIYPSLDDLPIGSCYLRQLVSSAGQLGQHPGKIHRTGFGLTGIYWKVFTWPKVLFNAVWVEILFLASDDHFSPWLLCDAMLFWALIVCLALCSNDWSLIILSHNL